MYGTITSICFNGKTIQSVDGGHETERSDVDCGCSVPWNEKWWYDWDGIIIQTEAQHIRFLISKEAQCCESFGITVDEKFVDEETLRELIGLTITHVNLNPKREAVYRKTSDTSKVCVDVSFRDQRVLKVDLFNFHNGYYPHNVWLCWEGTELFESI